MAIYISKIDGNVCDEKIVENQYLKLKLKNKTHRYYSILYLVVKKQSLKKSIYYKCKNKTNV